MATAATVARDNKRILAINVADLCPEDDDFTLLAQEAIVWRGFSGLPSNALERKVRGVRMSRYRAAFQAAAALRPERLIISHLPAMTAAASTAMALMGKHNRHLAFSFNFTSLPTGRRLTYMRRALRNVEQFAVFSAFEKPLYARHFDLDPAKIKPVIWTQDVPAVQTTPGLPLGAPYCCAIGGEGRDFKSLIEAARRAQSVRFVVIARPHSLTGLAIPDNVQVLSNIPSERVWRIAQDSLGVLVPLKSQDTCCGHITLVSAKMLGLPVITTFSHATQEYVEKREGVLVCEPGDPAALASLVVRLADEHRQIRSAAQDAAEHERAVHDRSQWADYLRTFIARKTK